MNGSSRRPPPRRRRPLWRPLLWGLALLAVLLLGISIGRALEEGPRPGVTETRVRTLDPQPLPPAARTTVTVTAG